MEVKFLSAVVFSFLAAFLLAPIFIGFLFRFNIRRVNKVDLEDKLPDRRVKFGTPVMGGALITFIVLLFLVAVLRNSSFFIPFAFVLVVGSIFGAIDEFVNTIGRRGFSFAVREAVADVVSKNSLTWALYKLFLIPWGLFKEIFRVMGSTQKGLKTHEKFLMQFSIALFVSLWFYHQFSYSSFWIPLFGHLNVGLLYIPILMFIGLWFANAFGVTDGMDGLSAGLHIIAFLSLGVLSFILGKYDAAFLCASVVGAELAFLYFNVYPARVEMSDVGTLPLGMLFVFIAAYIQKEFAMFIIGGVFMVEILSSFLQQWSAKLRNGKRVFLLAPIHHHFEKLGWHETKVTMRFWLAGSVFAFFGMLVALV